MKKIQSQNVDYFLRIESIFFRGTSEVEQYSFGQVSNSRSIKIVKNKWPINEISMYDSQSKVTKVNKFLSDVLSFI